jgi:hypothetical protein
LLRTVHVAAMVGCGAGILSGVPFANWNGYAIALLGSGLAILFLDRYANPDYFHQLDGLAVPVKLLVLGIVTLLLGPVLAFWLVLVISVMVSHAPGRWRHWRWQRK